MKQLALMAFAALSLTSASAADMPIKARPVAIPSNGWTGCYIGGNLGVGVARTTQSNTAQINGQVNNPPFDYGASTGTDFIGGAQIGCDYQFAGSWVVGVQGMFDFNKIKSEQILPAAPGFLMQNSTENLFTVTGRIGYLYSPALLGYVKAGGAFAKTDYVVTGFGPPAFLSENSLGNNRTGWTVGAGVEWMFARSWSVFGEFNYLDFGTEDIRFVAAPGLNPNADVVRTRLEVSQFLVGVNYKFNSGSPFPGKY